MIRILIVDDSRVSREHLAHILSTESDIAIVGMVQDGQAAIDFLLRARADVVLMDVEMPVLDGFETTMRIMNDNPLPIVMISAGWNAGEVEKTFRTLDVGALAILEKPPGPAHPDYAHSADEMRKTVRAMATVRVGRKLGRSRVRQLQDAAAKEACTDAASASAYPCCEAAPRIVLIGASTGGPAVLCDILGRLPPHYPLPILIVQHIAAGFVQGLVDWLATATGARIVIPADRDFPCPETVYIAPDGLHMTIGTDQRIRLLAEPPANGLRPSVSRLFASAAENLGRDAIGILLTGMGQDGAAELGEMRRRGAVTIAQDRASSIVYGMPGEAARRGAATYIYSPSGIVEYLTRIIKN